MKLTSAFTHMKVGFALFASIVGHTIWRWIIYTDAANNLGWGYLVTAFIVLVLTFFQGWLGGELVFSDGVGVAPTEQGTEPPDKAKGLERNGSAVSEGHQGHA